MVIILKSVLGVLTALFGFYYLTDVYKNRATFCPTPWPRLLGTGFITNMFDTLGIGSFAQQTAIFKFFKMVDDRIIPGTMNVGNTIPTVVQAFIFMKMVEVEPLTLAAMSIAAPAGAVLGAGVVAKMSRRRIQLGMGCGLLVIAFIILAGLLKWFPMGGVAIGLTGWKLVVAVVMSFIFGAMQTIGVGFYAPCMAIVYTLGMHPLTAYPIMMTATAMLMAAGSARFVKERAYDPKASIALTLFGILGVFLGAFLLYILKSMDINKVLTILRWMVICVVLYTSVWMFNSAATGRKETACPEA